MCHTGTDAHCSRALQTDEQTVIDLQEPVTLTFALRYLNSFTKASHGIDSMCLMMAVAVC